VHCRVTTDLNEYDASRDRSAALLLLANWFCCGSLLLLLLLLLFVCCLVSCRPTYVRVFTRPICCRRCCESVRSSIYFAHVVIFYYWKYWRFVNRHTRNFLTWCDFSPPFNSPTAVMQNSQWKLRVVHCSSWTLGFRSSEPHDTVQAVHHWLYESHSSMSMRCK